MPDSIIVNNDGVFLDLSKNFGIRWQEIYSIFISKAEINNEVVWFVILEYNIGEFIEVHSGFNNFNEFVNEIRKRFGLSENWLEIAKLNYKEDLVIWKKEFS